jgi:hypothetical protein
MYRALSLVAIGILACEAAPPQGDPAARVPTQPPAVVLADPDLAGQRVASGRLYVPTYSHIYVLDGEAEDMAVTLSIRNVSIDHEVVLDRVTYYDTHGKLLQEYLQGSIVLAPLETAEYFVATRDRRGGSGANFVVSWHADSPVVRPLTEAVMVRTEGSRAFAFSTRGIDIRNDAALPAVAAPEVPATTTDAAPEDGSTSR